MKIKLLNLFFSFIITFIFIGCVSGKNKINNLPSWYLNAPANTAITLYGIGEAPTLNDAKNAALKDMSERLVVSVTSSMSSITKSTISGNNSSYSKQSIRNLQVEAKKITFSNYKTNKAVQSGGSFYVLVSSNRDELFNEKKKDLEQIDTKIDNLTNNLSSKPILEQIYTLQTISPELKKGKNVAFVLYAIKNDFNYQVYHNKYDNLLNKIDILKDSIRVNVVSNIKNGLFKEHMVSLLNKNNYKISTNNPDVIIDINNNIRYSTARGWKIAKVSTTISVKTNGKTLSNRTINTLGRSSSTNKNALVASSMQFKKKIEKIGLDNIIFYN